MTKKMLRTGKAHCPLVNCVYNKNLATCDDVTTNRGNSDAACHKLAIESMKWLVKTISVDSADQDALYWANLKREWTIS